MTRTVFVILLLCLLSIGEAPAEAKLRFAETPVGDCVLVNLQANLEKNISLRKGPVPERISLALDKSEAIQDFNIAIAQYRKDWSGENLKGVRVIAEKAAAGKMLNGQDLEKLSDLRSSLKLTRSLFEVLSDDHRCPGSFDELATSVGKLRDKFGMGDEEGGVGEAAGKRVLKAISAENREAIDRAVRSFEPTGAKGFSKWLKESLKSTEKIVEGGRGVPDKLHDIRKSLQGLLAIYHVRKSLDESSRETRQIYNALVRQTELLGTWVQRYEIREIQSRKRTAGLRAKGEEPKKEDVFDVKKTVVTYDPGLMEEIKEFLDRIETQSGE